MHAIQSKHIKLKKEEADELLKKYNISLSQLPRILEDDPALPEGSKIGDIIKIERKKEDGKIEVYYRVVS